MHHVRKVILQPKVCNSRIFLYLINRARAEEPGLSSAFGAFLVFVSLLGGSAFGFLISQCWWVWFQIQGTIYGCRKPRKPIMELIKKYNLTTNSKIRHEKYNDITIEDKKRVVAVCNYITHLEKEDKISRYAQRRWDIYNLLSTELVTLIIGSVLGLSFRLICFRSFEVLIIFVIAMAFILALLIEKGRRWVLTQYEYILGAIINKSDVRQWQLRKVFPSDFFDD